MKRSEIRNRLTKHEYLCTNIVTTAVVFDYDYNTKLLTVTDTLE